MFFLSPFLNVSFSPLGLVPKKEPGSFHLIHHLSFIHGHSLNDETSEFESFVSNASFDEVLCLLKRFGRESLMAKADIKSAFRLLP